jgi:nudix-type nucleoside diphosphatase (YffH/AdpP family)
MHLRAVACIIDVARKEPSDSERLGEGAADTAVPLAAYANGHRDGMLIEACAGLLEDDDPETAIRREVREETGVEVGRVRALFTAYMSPGSVTERLHFYYASYDGDRRRGEGGGVAEEGEDMEVIELDVSEALAMVRSGEIVDAKTIMLLQWLAAGPADA